VRTLRRCGARREALEVSAPTLVYARGIAEVLLVKGVEEIGVTAVKRCRFKHAGRDNSEALV
jgi:hypothetical protein